MVACAGKGSPCSPGRRDLPQATKNVFQISCLVIDDWGLENLKDRHGLQSTIIAGQLPVEYWHEVVGNPTIADAIMDRLVHNAHKISVAPLRQELAAQNIGMKNDANINTPASLRSD